MIDKIFRRIIQAAIESFPIDRQKKARLLQNLLGERNRDEVKADVLQ